MKLDLSHAALVVTDPQIDFLSPDGVTWSMVGNSVTENNTVENIRRLFEAAKRADITVAVSPHYYYPTDHGWKFEGALEKAMHGMGMFDRPSAYSMEGFENSGADFMAEYKDYIFDGKTAVLCQKVVDARRNKITFFFQGEIKSQTIKPCAVFRRNPEPLACIHVINGPVK